MFFELGRGIAIVTVRREEEILISGFFFSDRTGFVVTPWRAVFASCLCVRAPPRWAPHAADGVPLIDPPLTCGISRPPIQPLPFVLFVCGVLFLGRIGRVFSGGYWLSLF